MGLVVFWENVSIDKTVSLLSTDPETHDRKDVKESRSLDFSGDIFVISSIIKTKLFAQQWIELGTDSGIESHWLRLQLSHRIPLVSYDSTHSSVQLDLPENMETGTIYFTNLESELLDRVGHYKGMQIILVHDLTHISTDILKSTMDTVSDFSMLIIQKDCWTEDIASENFILNEYWKDVANSIGSNLLVFDKKTKRDLGNFPWELFPIGMMDLESIHMPYPTDYTPNKDWIVFSRIQKCGTKTLTEIIKQQAKVSSSCLRDFWITGLLDYEECSLFDICSNPVVDNFREKFPNCGALLMHHCDWEDIFSGTWSSDDPSVYPIALVRNPVHRVVSEFKHVFKTHRKTWDYCVKSVGEDFSRETFLRYLEEPQHYAGTVNRQTRMLAGCGSGKECSEVYETEQEMLGVAKLHLLQCIDVGVLEHFTDFVVRLEYLFKWNIKEYSILTEGRDDMVLDWDIDEEVEQRILNLNYLDYELFQFASALSEYRTDELRILEPGLPYFMCEDKKCTKISFS